MNHVVSMTEDEVAVLLAIIYDVVGGHPSGPRKHVESLAAKLPKVSSDVECRYEARIEASDLFLHVVVEPSMKNQVMSVKHPE